MTKISQQSTDVPSLRRHHGADPTARLVTHELKIHVPLVQRH